MSQERKSIVGDPIWVESIMTPEEYREAAKKYPSMFNGTKPTPYDPNHHLGGRWRYNMGKGYTPEEIILINNHFDNLHNLLKTKKYQKRPDYGPHNEMKP